MALARKLSRDDDLYGRLAELFKALADPTRLRIIARVAEADTCVEDLAAVLGMTASAVSHQLRLLRTMRVVRARRDGRYVYYQLDDEHVRDLLERARDHLSHG
jgi:ArsR family transcriptional regulator, lead/cadmium/zinc/bismuth-responsive transcriptional repressor